MVDAEELAKCFDADELRGYKPIRNFTREERRVMAFVLRQSRATMWRKVSEEEPPMNKTIVCTDGKHRWFDMRMPGMERLEWWNNKASHWHPLADLPAILHEERHDD